MSDLIDDSRRHVVPRWRPFGVSAGLDELNSFQRTPALAPKPSPAEVREAIRQWRRHKTPFHAAEVVDIALLLDDPSVGGDAAEFLLSEGVSEISTHVARSLLDPVVLPHPQIQVDLTSADMHRRIAIAKRRLALTPYDAMTWVDIAREYSSLGQSIPAIRAIKSALSLAPNDRFVLRSSSRLFLHLRDPEQARHILRRSPRTRQDPWLSAAEIVTAHVAGQTSGLIKAGRKMVISGRMSPRDISELASAIGTHEFLDGGRRSRNKMLKMALEDPTENAVAQAGWMSRRSSSIELTPDQLRVPHAYEARAWESLREREFGPSVDLAWQWFADEPFATRPVLFGSWVASTALGEFRESIRFVDAGLMANPDDPRLLAMKFYCLASTNEITRAKQFLETLREMISRHPKGIPETQWDVLLEADRGLLAFRSGNHSLGRDLYRRAISLATKHDHKELAASAYFHLLREEAHANLTARLPVEEIGQWLMVLPQNSRYVYESFLARIPRIAITSSSKVMS